jgi:hypothetical protein
LPEGAAAISSRENRFFPARRSIFSLKSARLADMMPFRFATTL